MADIDVENDRLIEAVQRGYIEAGLWLAMDTNGAPITDSIGEYQAPDDPRLTTDAADLVHEDVMDFVLANKADVVEAMGRYNLSWPVGGEPYGGAADQIGHDFFLTRNGHGAGYWDRGLGDVGDRLTAAAKVYGEQTFIVAENGEVDVL